jgi:hypothetical protein
MCKYHSLASEPVFNLCQPARANAEFAFVNDDDESVSWNAHPDLTPGTRNRLIEAVHYMPRAWLPPPRDGEMFDTAEEGQASARDSKGKIVSIGSEGHLRGGTELRTSASMRAKELTQGQG